MKPIREALGLRGALYHAWTIPYGIAVLIIGLVYVLFLWRLPLPIRRLFIISAAVFLGGAVVMEMVGGIVKESTKSERTLLREACVVIEEGMEMTGVAIFLYGLVRYINIYSPQLCISVATPSAVG